MTYDQVNVHLARRITRREGALVDPAYDYGFSPQESYSTAASSRSQKSTRGPGSFNGKRQAGVDIGQYTKIPNRFFSSGMAARLGPSAGYLYIALCDHANRHSSNSFKASDKALASDTSLASRTICDLRKKLTEYGIISWTREKGQSHVYTLLKPSLEWKPLKERHRRILKPRALHASPSPRV